MKYSISEGAMGGNISVTSISTLFPRKIAGSQQLAYCGALDMAPKSATANSGFVSRAECYSNIVFGSLSASVTITQYAPKLNQHA